MIEDWYKILAKLGKGGGGSAYKAMDLKHDGEMVCLKIIDDSDLSGMLEVYKIEIDALLAIDNPFVVIVLDSFRMNNNTGVLCYTMELCDEGDLRD